MKHVTRIQTNFKPQNFKLQYQKSESVDMQLVCVIFRKIIQLHSEDNDVSTYFTSESDEIWRWQIELNTYISLYRRMFTRTLNTE